MAKYKQFFLQAPHFSTFLKCKTETGFAKNSSTPRPHAPIPYSLFHFKFPGIISMFNALAQFSQNERLNDLSLRWTYKETLSLEDIVEKKGDFVIVFL